MKITTLSATLKSQWPASTTMWPAVRLGWGAVHCYTHVVVISFLLFNYSIEGICVNDRLMSWLVTYWECSNLYVLILITDIKSKSKWALGRSQALNNGKEGGKKGVCRFFHSWILKNHHRKKEKEKSALTLEWNKLPSSGHMWKCTSTMQTVQALCLHSEVLVI